MKPEFVKYLQQDSILIVDGETKKKVLDAIIAHACTRCTMDEDQIREAIWKRERMMTTGVGTGLALPHIRINKTAEHLSRRGKSIKCAKKAPKGKKNAGFS